MHFSSLALLSILGPAATVLGAALSVQRLREAQAKAATISWSVTNWTAGCAANSTCTYGFQVSAPAYEPSTPAFHASCAGSGVLGAPYQSCNVFNATGQLVKARIQAGNTTESVKLAVSYEYIDRSAEDVYWNYTSFAMEPLAGVESFSMTPTQIVGVA
ncbi:unnamed protein product [Discula destructiva]